MTIQVDEIYERELSRAEGTEILHPVGRIMVVDDEPELRRILVESLAQHGYDAVGYGSAIPALAELHEHNFDVLVTDLMMPEMSGINFLKAALQIDPDLVGILMTGQGTIQTAVEAMKLGAFDYVLKPFSMKTFMPAVTRAMNTRHLRLENLQLRETVAIHGLCQTIAFTLDPQTVLSKLADAALQQSDANEVSILLPTSEGLDLYVAAVRGEKRERLLGERVPFAQNIASWVARTREPIILNGTVDDERFVALWPRPEISSAISIPMQVANKLVGVINLNITGRLRPFTLGQMKGLTILASTAAAALESASLYLQVQKAERNYRSIFENAVEGIFQSTSDRKFLAVNPALAEILGYESPQDVVDTFTDIGQQLYVKPELAREVTQKLASGGVLKNFEFEAYRKDRKTTWLSLNLRVVRDGKGEELFREGTLEDITERRTAEEEQARLNAKIKRQTDRVNTIVATVPGIVFEAWGSPDATDDRPDFVSEHIEPMLGYTVSEWLAVPRFWLSIVHPDDRQRVEQETSASFLQGANGEFEFRWVAKDGRIVWVRAHTVIVRSNEGKPIGMRGVVTDITERKRAEAERMVMFEIIQGSITTRNLQDFLKLIHRSIGKLVYAENCFVALYDEKTDLMHFEYWADQFDSLPPPLPPGKGFSAYVLRTNQPLLLTEELKNRICGAGDAEVKGRASASWLGIPLTMGRKAIGVLVVQHYQDKDAYAQRDLEFLSSVGDQIALAIERKRAEEMLQETLRSKAESLALLDTILASAPIGFAFLTPDLVYQQINESLAAINGLSPEAHIGKTLRDVVPELGDILEPLCKRVLETGEPIIDFEMSGRTPADLSAQHHWVVSFYPVRTLEAPLLGIGILVSEITERREAEEALRASEARYRELVENAHDLIYEHDLQGNYTATNKAAEEITGYSHEEALKMNLAQTLAPECLSTGIEMLRRKLAGETITAYDLEIIAKDGSRVAVEVNTRLVLKDGVPVGVQGIARDITERKRVEDALRNSEARKRAILESAMDCVVTMDHEGRVVDWNPAAEQTFGFSLEEARGSEMADLIIPERFKELHRQGLAHYLATGEGSQLGRRLELRAQRRDGTEFPVELTITRIELEGARMFTGYLRDITERKDAETRLGAQYEVARALAESTTINEVSQRILKAVGESFDWKYGGSWLVDPSSATLHCSDVWVAPGANVRQFAEASRERVFQIGVGFPGRVWKEACPICISDVGNEDNFPRRGIAEDIGLHGGYGFPIWLRSEVLGVLEFFSGSVLKPDRALLAMMATIGGQMGQFIEGKRVEGALGKTEEQLRQSQKLEAIGQLAGGVAHDFNNLLTVIGGYSSMILAKLPEDNIHRMSVEEIKKASDRASSLTRQLLAFSRKQILQPKVLDLNTVISDLDKMLRRLIGEDVDLLAITDPGLGKVKADPGQIEQVLLNLIVNARDAMPAGGKITVETGNVVLSSETALRHAATPGPYVMLAVSDTGCGIEDELQTHIFEPFFTTKGPGRGTGLGLATVYGIVRQSGGHVWLYSEVGKGTTFKIYLPRVDAVGLDGQTIFRVPLIRGTETILLVEDEDQVRKIVQAILEEQGYQVLAAANGLEALELAAHHNMGIQLVLTDVVMPQMGGRELADRLVTARPQLKILYMSGYTDDAIVRHGLLDSKLNFIQKPFDASAVARKIREVLDS